MTRSRITGLTDSEAYKQGKELDRLRRQAQVAAALAHRVRVAAARLRGDADGDQRELRGAVEAEARQAGVVRAAGEDARHAAVRGALDSAYQELAGLLAVEPGRARTLLRAVVRSRQEAITDVQRAVGRHETAVDRRTYAEQELDRARDEYAGAGERRDEAAEGRNAALADLQERLAAWATGLPRARLRRSGRSGRPRRVRAGRAGRDRRGRPDRAGRDHQVRDRGRG